MFKYYYELNYFPIPEKHLKEYSKVRIQGLQPKIKTKIAPGIFEVEDNNLFYTNNHDEFNLLIYKFKYPEYENILIQVARYKKIKTSTYSLCVKTTEILPNISVLDLNFNTDILKPVTFDINKYCRLEDPAYLVKKDGVTIDVIGIDDKIYAVNGNYGKIVGHFNSKKGGTDEKMSSQKQNANLFAKGELMIDNKSLVNDKSLVNQTIYIFDVYIVDSEALDIPYKKRMQRFAEINENIKLLNNQSVKEIKISKIHESFESAYKESQSINNDGIIIQGPFDEPLKWKPNAANTIDVLVEDDLYLARGLDQILSFKMIKNPSFNMKVIWDYRNKYPGEIIEIGIDGSFHRVRTDKLKPNAIKTYKNTIDQTTTIDKSIMIGDNSDNINTNKLALYIFNAYKEIILEKYVHGDTIEINIDCGVINKINTLLNDDNITTLQPVYSSNFSSCKIENKIDKTIDKYLESTNENFDTIIIETSPEFHLELYISSLTKLMKECGKIILFDSYGQTDKLFNDSSSEIKLLKDVGLQILENISLSNKLNNHSFPKSIEPFISKCRTIVLSKALSDIKPEFIFVVGLMGSGKSRLIDQIRNFIHPSSALNIISIDNEVAKYISYQLFANPGTYKNIRKKLDPIIDEKMNNIIKEKQSILLETTHIDKSWALDIGKTHKTIAVICNTSLAQIESNIEARNRVNIRQTNIDELGYQKFQEEIKTYPDFIDIVYSFDMGQVRSSGESIKELKKIKGGRPPKIDYDDIVYSDDIIDDYSDLIDQNHDDLITNGGRKIYLKLSDLTEEKEYVPYYQHSNKGVHYGQRKLLITEIMFLLLCADKNKIYNVIYAGSAANYKYPVLYDLFKNCRFILIDPNPFAPVVTEKEHLFFKDQIDIQKIKEEKHIRTIVINDLCTIPLIEQLSELDNILFISDIRTGLLADSPLEYDILLNVSQHKAWLDILYHKHKDIKFMLKSRCLYSLDQTEYLDDFIKIVSHMPEWQKYGKMLLENFENGKQYDFKGEVYLQPWIGEDSTEIRIVGNIPELELKDSLHNERKMFYYNVNLRINDEMRKIPGIDAFGLTENEIKSSVKDSKIFDLYCGCNDCAIEIHWIKKYVENYHITYDEIINLINLYAQPITKHKVGKSKQLKFDVNESKKAIVGESIYKDQFI